VQTDILVKANITRESGEGLAVPTKNGTPQGDNGAASGAEQSVRLSSPVWKAGVSRKELYE